MEIGTIKRKKIGFRGTDKARVIRVIETVSLIGDGTEENPIREITQYWSFDGKHLANKDNL